MNARMGRAVVAVGLWLCGAKLLLLLAAPVAAHPSWTAAHPFNIVWVATAILMAVGLVGLNRQYAWADYLKLPAATYGVLAAIVGFTVQNAINGPLVKHWANDLAMAASSFARAGGCGRANLRKVLCLGACFRSPAPSFPLRLLAAWAACGTRLRGLRNHLDLLQYGVGTTGRSRLWRPLRAG